MPQRINTFDIVANPGFSGANFFIPPPKDANILTDFLRNNGFTKITPFIYINGSHRVLFEDFFYGYKYYIDNTLILESSLTDINSSSEFIRYFKLSGLL